MIAVWSNVCITRVQNELTVVDVQAARRVYEVFAEEVGSGGFVSVIVVAPNVPTPSDEARKAIPDLMKGLESRVVAMVGVLEATGFKAAAIRSIMAAMSMLSKTSYPRKIAGSIKEAAPMIGPHLKPAASVDDVEAALEHVKRLS